jgi:hypothetical protein
MTYKQIEASREVRLWIGQVVVPAVTAGALLMSNPDIRQAVTTKTNQIKESIKNRLNKES